MMRRLLRVRSCPRGPVAAIFLPRHRWVLILGDAIRRAPISHVAIPAWGVGGARSSIHRPGHRRLVSHIRPGLVNLCAWHPARSVGRTCSIRAADVCERRASHSARSSRSASSSRALSSAADGGAISKMANPTPVSAGARRDAGCGSDRWLAFSGGAALRPGTRAAGPRVRPPSEWPTGSVPSVRSAPPTRVSSASSSSQCGRRRARRRPTRA
jgi:hypothetical protein